MPEPSGTAKLVGEILPGVYRFTIHDDRIDSESDSYAIIEHGKVILIDPLPMAEKDLKKLGPVEAVCLTGSCHERSAWRYRRELNVPVYAPQGGVDFEETPDRWYKAHDRLPGNLLAVHTPGPTEAHYSFYLEREGGVVFCRPAHQRRRGGSRLRRGRVSGRASPHARERAPSAQLGFQDALS